MKKHPKKVILLIVSIVFLVLIAVSFINLSNFTPSVKASNLMNNVSANLINKKSLDDKFKYNATDFSIKLFQKTISEQGNSLISPISVMLSLAMTANGADNETLTQIQSVIGNDIPIDLMNEYLYSYVSSLPSTKKSKLKISNSIWLKDIDSLRIEDNFLQTNADYYNASVYKSAFDNQTVKDINHWTKRNTDGRIDKILNKIDENNIMYIINAIMFDAKWDMVYEKKNVNDLKFTNKDGSNAVVHGMQSFEGYYLEDEKATGFIKNYYHDSYRFVALLPKKDISFEDFINNLTGESFRNIIRNAQNASVNAILPKFKYDYSITMNDALISLGMPDAFSEDIADFSKLGTSSIGNIYINDVLHKAYIAVDELGTKAGAITKIGAKTSSSNISGKTVILDRPFVYAIIDTSSSIPLFIGTVTNLD